MDTRTEIVQKILMMQVFVAPLFLFAWAMLRRAFADWFRLSSRSLFPEDVATNFQFPVGLVALGLAIFAEFKIITILLLDWPM